jgi:hypothetical protein
VGYQRVNFDRWLAGKRELKASTRRSTRNSVARMLLGAAPAAGLGARPGSVGGATAAPVAPLVVGLLVLAVLGISI